jgi:hypothetical protein
MRCKIYFSPCPKPFCSKLDPENTGLWDREREEKKGGGRVETHM